MIKAIEQHIKVATDNQLAIDCLASHTDLSKQKLKEAMNKGCVWLTVGKKTQRIRRAKKALKCGQSLHIYYDEKILSAEPPEPQLLADEGDYSVWNKPSGLLSQGSKWGDHCTITRWAEQHLTPQRNSFVVHRLDRAASGIILVAHSKAAASKLSQLFATREITKTYHAVIEGIWPHCEQHTIAEPIDGKPSISHVNFISSDKVNNSSMLQITIETGRKHQIRRHLSEFGYPIIGDRLYGSTKLDDNLKLMAVSLTFICPFSQSNKQYQLMTNMT